MLRDFLFWLFVFWEERIAVEGSYVCVCVCVRTWLLAESVQKKACVHFHACSGVACECQQINDKDSVAARNRFHK